MTSSKLPSLRDLLTQVDQKFVQAAPIHETDDQLATAALDWILERERIRHQVNPGSAMASKVDQSTIQKMLTWDSDDLAMAPVEKVLRRLAQGRKKDALRLVQILHNKAEMRSAEMRRRAKTPRDPHPIQSFIDELVKIDPQITEKQVFKKMCAAEGGEVIFRITDEAIEPQDINFNSVKISGLKNRLTEAKKKISPKQ